MCYPQRVGILSKCMSINSLRCTLYFTILFTNYTSVMLKLKKIFSSTKRFLKYSNPKTFILYEELKMPKIFLLESIVKIKELKKFFFKKLPHTLLPSVLK